MSDKRSNSLGLSAPTSQEIADVAADIVRAVRNDFSLTEGQLADKLEVSPNTIGNLQDKATQKVPAGVIASIGALYGAQYIQPYMALFGCKAVNLHREEAINALPALTALVAKVAANIRDGGALDHQALAAMLPELREADGVIATLRARASDLGLPA